MSISLQNVRRSSSTYGAEHGDGFSEDALLEVKELVMAESPGATPLIDAIEEAAQGLNIYHSAEHYGRRLIAAVDFTKPQMLRPIEAIMYVEGSDFVRSTFDSADLSQWVSSPNRFIPGARYLRNNTMTRDRADRIRSLFYGHALDNWDEHWQERGNASRYWGLPVTSNTRVTPVGNQEGDIQVPFSHGDWHDMLAVSGLRIPAEKKALIIATVAGAHAEARLETLVKS